MTLYATRDGSPWEPAYLTAISEAKCIGCARCFKVCARDVMHMYNLDSDNQVLGKAAGGDDDDLDAARTIMMLDNEGACIGCEACARACPKGCMTYTKATQLAAAAA